MIPTRRPRIAHFLPYLFGDSPRAIRVAKRLGWPWIDQNGHADRAGVAWVLHWRRYRLEFPWYWTGRYVGRREVRRPVPRTWPRYFDNLTTRQASRLRSQPLGGRRPRKAVAHMGLAAEADIGWAYEAKNSPPFTQVATWERVASDRDRTGARVVIMVLTSWAYWRKIVRAALAAGLPVAVLPRTPKPADWSEFEAQGVRVWGRWRRA